MGGLDQTQKLWEGPARSGRKTLVKKNLFGTMERLSLLGEGAALRVHTSDYRCGFNVSHLVLEGGTIAGWSKVNVLGTVKMRGNSTVSLRGAARLQSDERCRSVWVAGSMIMGEGANWINRGELKISAGIGYDGESYEIGYAREGPMGDGDWLEGRQIDFGAWYTNPICGPHCGRPPFMINMNFLNARSSADCMTSVTFRNRGIVSVDYGSILDFGGGGDAGGNGTLFLVDGNLRLSGGNFQVENSVGILYNGTLEVTEGSHIFPAIVYPRLVIRGGIVECRTRVQDMFGGFEIHGDGAMAYTVSNAVVTVRNGNVTITGGELRFVQIQEFAAIHPAQLHINKRNADRSYMTLFEPLEWKGGTIKGNVEIGANRGIKLGGVEKRLEALCHIINYGVMLWSQGDVVIANQANLVNVGTMEMKDPSNFHARLINLDESLGGYPDSTPKQYMWEDNDAAHHPHSIGSSTFVG